MCRSMPLQPSTAQMRSDAGGRGPASTCSRCGPFRTGGSPQGPPVVDDLDGRDWTLEFVKAEPGDEDCLSFATMAPLTPAVPET
jgi:hypothetical protein